MEYHVKNNVEALRIIEKLRQEKNITMSELSRSAGFARGHLWYQLHRQGKNFSLNAAAQYARALRISFSAS